MSVPERVIPGRTVRRDAVSRGWWRWALAGVLAAGGATRAEVVVANYGGDYVTSNTPFTSTVQTQTGQSFGGFSGNHDSRSIVPYSDTTPQISLAGTSGTFYGGYESVNYG